MISIIICSISDSLLTQVSANICETIGVEHEIIAIDNRGTENGICQVYNSGAKRAKYNILLFLHEDMIFHTLDWGRELVSYLEDSQTGIIGISGSVYKSGIPAPWSAISPECYRSNAVQRFKDGRSVTAIKKESVNVDKSEVVVLDGCFLAMRKDVWQHIPFNEKIAGFHFYDLDISLRIREKYKLFVQHKILVEHLSEGVINKSWLSDAIILRRYFVTMLPQAINNYSKRQILDFSYSAAASFVWACLRNNQFCYLLFRYFIFCIVVRPLSVNNLNMLKCGMRKVLRLSTVRLFLNM